jgi:uncharacterized membrane protein YgaE (UPF0421/DUF939 family)
VRGVRSLTSNINLNLMSITINTDRAIHSIKTAFACLLGFLILQFAPGSTQPWLIITVIVVMCAQINVGSVLQKSYMRFLGTAVGCILAIMTLFLFGTDKIALISCVCITTLFFSYLATSDKPFNETGTLGAVTVAIILMGQNPSILNAGIRSLEISCGILIAALVSQFIFPIHARAHLFSNQASSLRQLRDYYQFTLMTSLTPQTIPMSEEMEEKIITLFMKQRKLAKDAKQELIGRKFKIKKFQQLLQCERQMLRSIILMHQTYEHSEVAKDFLSNELPMQEFNKKFYTALTDIAEQIEKNKGHLTSAHVPEIIHIKAIAKTALKKLNTDDYLYVSNFLFCIEMLVKALQELVVLKTRK